MSDNLRESEWGCETLYFKILPSENEPKTEENVRDALARGAIVTRQI